MMPAIEWRVGRRCQLEPEQYMLCRTRIFVRPGYVQYIVWIEGPSDPRPPLIDLYGYRHI